MNHCRRMANYGTILGTKLGLPKGVIKTIQRGAYLHDIGKIAISDRILLKPGPLTNQEFNIIKKHPMIGEKICQPLNTLYSALPIIRHHHERYNGSGYPDGLSKEKIPLTAQIVAIVDCYDALTSNRPYRVALSKSAAIKVIKKETKDNLWHPEISQFFLDIVSNTGNMEAFEIVESSIQEPATSNQNPASG